MEQLITFFLPILWSSDIPIIASRDGNLQIDIDFFIDKSNIQYPTAIVDLISSLFVKLTENCYYNRQLPAITANVVW